MLASLEASLTPHVRAAGLEPCDRAAIDDVAWLELRRNDDSGLIVLSIFDRHEDRTITAEVWHPERVFRAVRNDSSESAADRQRIWLYDPSVRGTCQ